MKFSDLAVAFILALASARSTPPPSENYNASNIATIAADPPEGILHLPYPFASDDVYNKCKCKGENFWKAMHSTSAGAGKLFNPARDSSESAFTDIPALTKWSWQDAKVPPTIFEFEKAWGVDHVLRAIGVSDKATVDGGSIQVLKVTHGDGEDDAGGFGPTPYDSQPQYQVGDKKYSVTGAEYTFGIETSGVLLAMIRKSPQYAGSQRKPKIEGDGLPDLKSFSDVAWLKWKGTTGNAPSSVRYFFTIAITNQETNGVLSRVLSEAKFTEVPAWPGHAVAANTEQGAALLGTPNALAFSYFLVQHKASLGNLKVSKVTIFKNRMKFPDTCMLFHVEQVSAEDMEVTANARL